MAATLRHVADRAGVSVSTVSRAFSHPHLLSAETVARIVSIAREAGYVPNPLARGLITGTAANVGLIVPDIAGRFFAELTKAAQLRARTAGHGMLIAGSEGAAASEAEAVRQFGPQVGGVVLCSPRMTEERLTELSAERPLVLVNRLVPGIPAVLIDSAAAVRAAVGHLAGHGHRRIAYLPGPERAWSNHQRQAAVEDECRDLGLEPAVVLRPLDPGAVGHEAGHSAVPELLASGATAVIGFDDALAAGVLTGLRDAGVAVPAEMSVVGCDDLVAAECRPRLTSITGRIPDAGRAAVDLLLSTVERGRGPRTSAEAADAPGSADVVWLPAALVVRESTGPARN